MKGFEETLPALLIIDMINKFDFTHGEILSQKASQIAVPIKELRNLFIKQKLPVIFINDHYNLWQANLDLIVDYCRNERSEPVFKTLLPEKDDYFLIKPKHSAFYGTALNTLLHSLKVNTLILCGIAGNICVLFTANDAYMREYKLIVPKNTIASTDDHDNLYAIRMMENVLKADVQKTAQEIYEHYIISPSPPS
ncbi:MULTISPECIES: isochorismatase family cysteine hydrolase [unclassified Bacillus (in: firmicutes)]|uniref:isochorismatase family cysteine hydrolase n=1 Tax=unclassified Bacillus (in: firmicutes) TaxID=185979 RepID=UPI0008F3921B|nr:MULTISPECIES: isochorismatase family cysteine hydrolase [unclassified Bacillus (in: firmicutes)]SFB26606.1 Nicotinamidase-related amidase [Bacillus sp. UNCCL13]SFQ92010.1 Nicotinamidase-related amidase [Bacillus sp. cl95]